MHADSPGAAGAAAVADRATATGAAIGAAVAALPPGPLEESAVQRHLAPLFARHRAAMGGRVYLANHSLGRPLDAMRDDVAEGLEAWYAGMGGAWDAWMAECDAYRARYAGLIGAARADCVVPKTSAGQGLRAVINALPGVPRVVATRGEFDSLDMVLRVYAERRRIALDLVAAGPDGRFRCEDIAAAIMPGVSLVVVSEVMFATGQRLAGIAGIVAAAHAVGARVLVDVYHSLGVVPVDVAAAGVDFAVGGAYKYLRGGPGACFLYVAPQVLEAGLVPLDTGWFAKEAPFSYARPEPPRFGAGGDAWLESTPPVLTWYQARAGARFVQALGVARLREHSLRMLGLLREALSARGLASRGGDDAHGAFLVVERADAGPLARRLADAGVLADARGTALRLCPDVLSTRDELAHAASVLAGLAGRASVSA